MLRLLTVGVGDAFSARHYSTCLALECAGRWLLLECPHPIRKMLLEASVSAGVALDVGELEAVAVSHLHADHSSGLEGLGFHAHFVVGRRPRLLMHGEVSARLWERLAAGMEEGERRRRGLADYFEVSTLREEHPLDVGPFHIECRRTRHHIPTTAFRVHAGGASFAYSGDTAFDASLVAWLAEADLVVHETNLGPAHTPFESLAGLPQEVRSRMRLVHCPDGFDAGGLIEVLAQGRLYEVGGS